MLLIKSVLVSAGIQTDLHFIGTIFLKGLKGNMKRKQMSDFTVPISPYQLYMYLFY